MSEDPIMERYVAAGGDPELLRKARAYGLRERAKRARFIFGNVMGCAALSDGPYDWSIYGAWVGMRQ